MAYEKKGRKNTDWESVEPLFRTGTLSNPQICEQYAKDHQYSQTYKTTITETAIRLRAKEKGWKRNLADRVKARISEKLLRDQLRDSNLSDDQTVEEAAGVGVQIVLRHQKEINALVSIEQSLLSELEELNRMKGIDGEDKIKLSERTIILKNLTETRAKRIAMERQANNIDAATSKDDVQLMKVEFVK